MTKDECMAFWVRAKDRLRDNKLTIKAFAAASGVSVNTIYSQIRQGIAPGIDEFMVLVAITNSDPYWLVWGDNPPTAISPILAAYAAEHEKLGRLDMAELAKKANEMQTLINKLKEYQ